MSLRRVLRVRRVSPFRRDRESGAALVEAAMVLPLIVVLFMGIIDFGLAIADFNSLRQGDREGVRRAVVADVGSDDSCVIQGAAPTDSDMLKLVCLTKARTGLDASKTRVGVKFDASYQEGDAMILCTQFPLRSRTGFFGFILDGKLVHAQVDMRIERDTLGLDDGEFLEGGGWDWCG